MVEARKDGQSLIFQVSRRARPPNVRLPLVPDPLAMNLIACSSYT
jgi:hypothetical protein